MRHALSMTWKPQFRMLAPADEFVPSAPGGLDLILALDGSHMSVHRRRDS